MHLFIALSLPESAQKVVDEIAETYKMQGIAGRWIPSGNHHVELCELRGIDERNICELINVMEATALTVGSIDCELDGLSNFKNRGKYATFLTLSSLTERIDELRFQIKSLLYAAGLRKKSRCLTSTSIRLGQHLSDLCAPIDIPSLSMALQKLVLYEIDEELVCTVLHEEALEYVHPSGSIS